jgi:hypothetical protein
VLCLNAHTNKQILPYVGYVVRFRKLVALLGYVIVRQGIQISVRLPAQSVCMENQQESIITYMISLFSF